MSTDYQRDIDHRLFTCFTELSEYSPTNDCRELFLVLYIMRFLSSPNHPYKVAENATIQSLLSHGKEHLDARIMLAWLSIQRDNSPVFDNILSLVDFESRLWGERSAWQQELYSLLKNLQSLPFEEAPVDIYQTAFSNLIDAMHQESKERYTPNAICKLLVKLLQPENKKSIYDPTCGSANFLSEAINTIKKNDGGKTALKITGEDINYQPCALARLNMAIHGETEGVIHQTDCLNALTEKTYDYVLSNPPFSMKSWRRDKHEKSLDDAKFAFGTPPDNNADYAFIQHIIASLNANGRAAIMVSNGALNRKKEQEIRANIIHAGLIDAVISLPANLFFHTDISTNILIIKKDKSNTDILFINANDIYEKGKNKNKISERHIETITSYYQNRKTVKSRSRLVSLDEIEASGYSLEVSRYIQEEHNIQLKPLSELLERQRSLEAELLELQSEMHSIVERVKNNSLSKQKL